MVTKEQMHEYLNSNLVGCGFEKLYDSIINKDNCVLCGLCVSLCPRLEIKDEKPALMEYDPECSMCFKYCGRTYFPKEVFENENLNKQTIINFNIGNFQKATAAKSTDEKVLKSAQSGGVVSTLLIHALETGLIDGALLTDTDENWVPKPVIAKTPDEILKCSGSKYTVAPSLLPFNDAVNKFKLEKLAFVGVPCQIQSARKLKLWNPISDKYGKFSLIIGVYCYSNFSYDLMRKYIQNDLGIPLTDVKKIDITRGKLHVYRSDGSLLEIPLKEIKQYYWPSCNNCKDYTAEFADISIGSVGAPENNWNSVIIRSDVGLKVFKETIAAGKLIEANTIDLSKIEKEAIRKKVHISRINEKLLSAMKLFNLSNNELRTYVTLVSLGYTNLSMLDKVMPLQENEIREALNSLQQRGWILYNDGLFIANNPNEITHEEVSKLRKELEKNIKSFETGALKDLETLFLQNNSIYSQTEEFKDTTKLS